MARTTILGLIASFCLQALGAGADQASDPTQTERSCPQGNINIPVKLGKDPQGKLIVVAFKVTGSDNKACSYRWLSEPKDLVTVTVTAPKPCKGLVDVAFDEQARLPQLQQDFQTLLKLVEGRAGGKPVTAGVEEQCVERAYSLTHRYGTLGIKITGDPVPPATSPTELRNNTFLTGPAEHFSLSANVPITTAKQFNYDSNTKTLTTAETPQKFMLGVDYWFSDLATQNNHNVGLRALFEFSSRPTTSYGLALAYRGRFLGMEAFSPFVGALATRSDETKNGVVSLGTKQNINFVWGISFNLDAALKWTDAGKKSPGATGGTSGTNSSGSGPK